MVDVQNKPEWGDLLAQLAVRSPVSLEIPGSSHTGRALHYRQFGAPPVNEAGQLTIYNFKPERTQRAGEQSREAHRTKASGKIGGGGGGVGGYRRVHVVDEDTQTAQAVGLYKLEQVRLRGPAGLRKGVEVHARRVHHAHRVLLPVLQEALGGPHPAELPHACRRAGAVGLVPVGVQGHVQVVGVAEVRVVEHVELHSHALRQATVPQLRPGAAHRRRSSALDHEGETVAAVQAEFPHVPLVETPVPPQALVPLLRHDPPAHLTPLQLHLAAAKSVACRDLQQEGGLEPVLHPLRRCVPRRPGPPGRRRG
mmetsp:Transcript_71846/g.191755  ORF Transcript_71846/g.191755 Transcript_71846/m.191755 type:complete len:310 (+) Transcript_71846:513-1442(+)